MVFCFLFLFPLYGHPYNLSFPIFHNLQVIILIKDPEAKNILKCQSHCTSGDNFGDDTSMKKQGIRNLEQGHNAYILQREREISHIDR